MGGATIADIGVDSTSYTVYLNLLLTTKGKSSSCHTERRKKKLKCICRGRGGASIQTTQKKACSSYLIFDPCFDVI
jgi:hypothetical protein